jgi:hypothetical protein
MSPSIDAPAPGGMKFSKAILAGLAIQLVAVAAFVLISKTLITGEWFKGAVIAVGFVAMTVLIVTAMKSRSMAYMALLAAIFALGFLVAWDVLAALFFPVLMQELPFGSDVYVKRNAQVFAILFVLYFCVGGVAKLSAGYDYFKVPGRLSILAVACVSLALQVFSDVSHCAVKYSGPTVPLVVMPAFFFFIAFSVAGINRLGKTWWYRVVPVVTLIELGMYYFAPRYWILGCTVN